MILWFGFGGMFFWAIRQPCGAEPAPLSTRRGIFHPGGPSSLRYQCSSVTSRPPITPCEAIAPLATPTSHTPLGPSGSISCPCRAKPAHPLCRRHPQRFIYSFGAFTLHIHTKPPKTNPQVTKPAPAETGQGHSPQQSCSRWDSFCRAALKGQLALFPEKFKGWGGGHKPGRIEEKAAEWHERRKTSCALRDREDPTYSIIPEKLGILDCSLVLPK